MRPHYCAVFPQLGMTHPKGYVDTGVDLNGPGGDRVYLSVEALEQLAQGMGWAPPAQVAVLNGERDRLKATVKGLEDRVAAAEEFRQAAEYTLGQFGAKVTRKPGRKP